MRQATAAEVRKNTAGIIKAPRRMPVAEAVHKYMRVTSRLSCCSTGNHIFFTTTTSPVSAFCQRAGGQNRGLLGKPAAENGRTG